MGPGPGLAAACCRPGLGPPVTRASASAPSRHLAVGAGTSLSRQEAANVRLPHLGAPEVSVQIAVFGDPPGGPVTKTPHS